MKSGSPLKEECITVTLGPFESKVFTLAWAEKKILKKGGLKSWQTAQKQVLK